MRADILCEDGVIKAVSENLEISSGAEVIDAGGQLVIPEGVPSHTVDDLRAVKGAGKYVNRPAFQPVFKALDKITKAERPKHLKRSTAAEREAASENPGCHLLSYPARKKARGIVIIPRTVETTTIVPAKSAFTP